jgi:hypothetical protein
MGIDFDLHLNLIRSRQGETDYDQKREKSADSVNQLLHGCLHSIIGRLGPDYSTDLIHWAQCAYDEL